MRVGAEDRVGRGPSNISMMIIRPPQHGHRRAGKGVSVASESQGDVISRLVELEAGRR